MNRLNFAKRACAVLALCAATTITLQAQTFTTVHNFDGLDGANPIGALVQASDGRLYGSTTSQGANEYGTIFEITPSGALRTVYNFCAETCGVDPGTLIQATDGNLYGTTWNDVGTLFRFNPKNGTLTTLYDFWTQGGGTEGAYPRGSLVQAADGNFYGTTESDGAYGQGTVFKVTPGGTLTTLYNFCAQTNCADGSYPEAGLIQASDGNFYGTTVFGGAQGEGMVFKITHSGTLTTLYSFCTQNTQNGCPDGYWPAAGLVQAADGNFYGTTYYGGAYDNGTVFRITPGGTLTTLYSFVAENDVGDGRFPDAALIQATDGNLYGTTYSGGWDEYGTVFQITLSGTLTTLHSFDRTDGEYPEGALVEDTNGTLYGTTSTGGTSSGGTIYTVSMGLGPFVETNPGQGKAGRLIRILGTNLAGATSVTFNGTSAVFKIRSNSLIGAVVPAGATSGTVQVTTPSGVLSSNVPFRVMP